MKPIVLVLLVATSALAVPVSVIEYERNEIPRAPPTKRVSRALLDRAFDIVDGGDTNVHILNLEEVLKDLADRADSGSQALAVAEAIGVLVELAPGIPGDVCAAAALIETYTDAVKSCNYAAVRPALIHFFKRLSLGLEQVVKFALNPNSVKYSKGVGSGCVGGGRKYPFEAAWETIFTHSHHNNIGLVDEGYCAAKRLYNAFHVRSNNVGALTTALALPPVVESFKLAINPAAGFLYTVGNYHDASALASALSVALLDAAGRVRLEP